MIRSLDSGVSSRVTFRGAGAQGRLYAFPSFARIEGYSLVETERTYASQDASWTPARKRVGFSGPWADAQGRSFQRSSIVRYILFICDKGLVKMVAIL